MDPPVSCNTDRISQPQAGASEWPDLAAGRGEGVPEEAEAWQIMVN
jgi:hypothetical protein